MSMSSGVNQHPKRTWSQTCNLNLCLTNWSLLVSIARIWHWNYLTVKLWMPHRISLQKGCPCTTALNLTLQNDLILKMVLLSLKASQHLYWRCHPSYVPNPVHQVENAFLTLLSSYTIISWAMGAIALTSSLTTILNVSIRRNKGQVRNRIYVCIGRWRYSWSQQNGTDIYGRKQNITLQLSLQ